MELTSIEHCQEDIESVIKNTHFKTVCRNFQCFITNFKLVLQKFESNAILENSRPHVQDRILLCFSQLKKCLLLMTSLLKSSLNSAKISGEIKSFISQRIISCLELLKEIFKEAFKCPENKIQIPEINNEEDEDLSGGLFIVLMDQALSLLAVFEAGLNNESTVEENMSLSQWRTVVDNLLGHAMTIAQVASSQEFKEIHCCCEKILREFECLRTEYDKPKRNACECKLYTVSLTAALEKLEQRVCAAVLKMHLQIFSDSNAPLRSLVRTCWKEPVEENRSADDVENLVSIFDAHMDKLVQVALFAIACSTSQSLVRSIRSCLASLESLEPHLVPALQTLYLRKKDRDELKQFVRFLSEHWNEEIQSLNGYIDLIVDPAALAQVAYDEARIPAAFLKKLTASGKSVSSKETHQLVSSVISPISALVRQLGTLGKSADMKLSPTLNSSIEDLLKALQHLKDFKSLPEISDLSKRCLKRCEVVVCSVKRMIPLLEEAFSVDPKAAAPPSPPVFPDSVRDLPQDISNQSQLSNQLDIMASDLKRSSDYMDPKTTEISLQLQNFPRASLRSTSFLYKEKETPTKQRTGSKLLRSVLMENARRSGIKRRSSIFNRTLEVPENSKQETVMQESLELTALLDGLCSLSESLASDQFLPKTRNDTGRCSNLDLSDDEYASCLGIEISVNSEGSSISTSQRLRDLADLREKIDALRKEHNLP